MFRKEKFSTLCEQILIETAQRHNIQIVELNVMPEHVHMIVQLPSTMSISRAMMLLKGASSHEIFKQVPDFRKRYHKGHFWSCGKFYRSVGDVDLETTKQYVKNQVEIHQLKLNTFV